MNSGRRKFWFPGSPLCSFTATFPRSSRPRASYALITLSGLISFIKYTFDFSIMPLLLFFRFLII